MRSNFFIIIALIFLTACQMQAGLPAETPARGPTGASIVVVAPETQTPEPPAAIPEPQDLSEKPQTPDPEPLVTNPKPLTVVEQLLHAIDVNITSYSFFVGKTQVFVLNDTQRILFGDFVELPYKTGSVRTFITDAYVNRATQEAVAYCDVRREERILGSFNADRSKCVKLINVAVNVSFDDVFVRTPVDWLEEFKDIEPVRVETVDQFVKQPTGWFTVNPVLHFEKDGKAYVLRIDKKTKMPVKIEITSGNSVNRVEFTWLLVNNVKPEDVAYTPFLR